MAIQDLANKTIMGSDFTHKSLGASVIYSKCNFGLQTLSK